MKTSTRCYWSLAVLLTALANRSAGAEPLSRVEIAKIGKAATALVEIKDRRAYGSAFCIHRSGLFITNDHVAQGDLAIILKPGSKDEKVYKAKVVRSDKELDLALLRIEGVKDLPTLSLGSDDKLAELMELVAVGFPFGTAVVRKGYPEVSINVGSIAALRRNKDDALERIQLDAALNPGNSGGPVLDKDAKVVGVVVSGILGTGVNQAIPVSILSRFVARPDIHFDPPRLGPANIHKPVLFEAVVLPILKPTTPITVELVLKAGNGKERRFPLEAAANGKYHASVVPLPPPPDGATVRLLADFGNSMLNAITADRTFKVGVREVKLSEVERIRFRPTVRVVLQDGKAVQGVISGLEAVPVQLGEQLVLVNLVKAAAIRFGPPAETDQVSYTLVVRQGENEILRQNETLAVEGLLPSPGAMARMSDGKVGEVRRFEGHTGAIRNVAYSPNGRYVLSRGGWPKADGTIRLWDVATGKEVRLFGDRSTGDGSGLAFSSDSRHALSSSDGVLLLWDVASGKEVRRFHGHTGVVHGVVFSPDDRYALSGSIDKTLRLWDLNTGQEVRKFEGHTEPVNDLAFSPDGRHVASGSQAGTLRVWELATGKEVKRLDGHHVAYSPNSQFLLSGGRGKNLHLWDAETGKEIRQFIGHTALHCSVAFSPDGHRALSGGHDGTIRLWEVATGKELHRFEKFQGWHLLQEAWAPEGKISPVHAVFSPDGHYAFSGGLDGIGRLWRLPDPPAAKDMP